MGHNDTSPRTPPAEETVPIHAVSWAPGLSSKPICRPRPATLARIKHRCPDHQESRTHLTKSRRPCTPLLTSLRANQGRCAMTSATLDPTAPAGTDAPPWIDGSPALASPLWRVYCTPDRNSAPATRRQSQASKHELGDDRLQARGPIRPRNPSVVGSSPTLPPALPWDYSSSPYWAALRRSSRQWMSCVSGCRHSLIRYSKPGSSTIGSVRRGGCDRTHHDLRVEGDERRLRRNRAGDDLYRVSIGACHVADSNSRPVSQVTHSDSCQTNINLIDSI